MFFAKNGIFGPKKWNNDMSGKCTYDSLEINKHISKWILSF